ncbi:hypothetical protein OG21DRAFT_1426972 [Imleria badia]|nr:hypothetical protein OG21DRAFT_1426972 [Imleria badia]
MADPNLEVCPDYALPEFEDERLIFTLDGKAEEEAIALLRNLWGLSNARDIEAWERQRAADAEVKRQHIELARQQVEQQRALRAQEEADAKKEEQKKFKNKFTPLPNRPLPDIALILPSQHVLNKLCKGDYVALFLFTNKGIREAEEDGSGDEDLLTLVQTDKGPTFQTSASVKAKKHRVKDEALSWEEFSQANYRMLNAMRQQEWPADCLKMIHDFWIAIETHSWRHDPSEHRQRALLIYQGRIRKDWHKTLGMVDAFCLLPLHAGHLNDYHQELLDNAYASKIDAICMVSTLPTIVLLTETNFPTSFPLTSSLSYTLALSSFMPIPMLYAGCFSHTEHHRDAGTYMWP